MSVEFALLMFPMLLVFLFFGFPVAFSLMGVALVFGLMRFGDSAIGLFVAKVDDVASNYVLGAVPLFIFMGSLLERSGVAERLFEAIHMWTRRLPGGLAIGTVLLCVVFAASTGIVGATETVVGSPRHPGDAALCLQQVASFPARSVPAAPWARLSRHRWLSSFSARLPTCRSVTSSPA